MVVSDGKRALDKILKISGRGGGGNGATQYWPSKGRTRAWIGGGGGAQRDTVFKPGAPLVFPRCCVSLSIWEMEHGKQKHVRKRSAQSDPCKNIPRKEIDEKVHNSNKKNEKRTKKRSTRGRRRRRRGRAKQEQRAG